MRRVGTFRACIRCENVVFTNTGIALKKMQENSSFCWFTHRITVKKGVLTVTVKKGVLTVTVKTCSGVIKMLSFWRRTPFKNCYDTRISGQPQTGNWYQFSTSNKRTSARPHWSRYRLCAKLPFGKGTGGTVFSVPYNAKVHRTCEISTVVNVCNLKYLAKSLKIWNASRICVSSLRRGHANLLCIVPILSDVSEETIRCLRLGL